jgi:hypothetical protein
MGLQAPWRPRHAASAIAGIVVCAPFSTVSTKEHKSGQMSFRDAMKRVMPADFSELGAASGRVEARFRVSPDGPKTNQA